MSAVPAFTNTGGRRSERKAWSAEVQFRSGNRRATVRLADISQQGARVKGVFRVHEDDVFLIKMAGMESIEARVVWTEEFVFGCEFLRPLNPVILETLVNNR